MLRDVSFKVWEWEWNDQEPPSLRVPSREDPAVEEWINQLVSKGFLEETSSRHVHTAVAHFSLPKPHEPTARRVVGDFRPLNRWIKPLECEYPTPISIWARAATVPRVATCDIMDGFYQVIVPKAFRRYLGIQYRGRWYRYTRMPQGFINAPAIFMRFMKWLVPTDPRIMYYMDDVFGFDMSKEELSKMIEDTGLPIKAAKTRESDQEETPLLGISVKHSSHHVEYRPLGKAMGKFSEAWRRVNGRLCSKRRLYEYAGIVQFYAPFIPAAAAHLFTLYRAAKKIRDWEHGATVWRPPFALEWPFCVRTKVGTQLNVYADASQEGYGLQLTTDDQPLMRLSQLRLDKRWRQTVGIYRELQALRWCERRMQGIEAIYHTDSEPIVKALRKGHLDNWKPAARRWLSSLKQEWTYVAGEDNCADAASRSLYEFMPKNTRTAALTRMRRAGYRNMRKNRKTPPHRS